MVNPRNTSTKHNNNTRTLVCAPSKQAATGSEEPVAASLLFAKEKIMSRNQGFKEQQIVPCARCHQETVIEFYPNQSEKQKRARAKKALCPECYKSQKSGEAAEYNRRRGYSSLKGSPKQIAWAESIRKKNIFRIVNHLEVINQKEFARRTEKHLGSKTSAAWWVEHSEYSTIEDYINELINKVTQQAS